MLIDRPIDPSVRTKTIMVGILLVIGDVGFARGKAWHDTIVTNQRNIESDSGGFFQTESKLICNSARKARQATRGDDELIWREIDQGEYCRMRTRHYSDNWRNGWKRSRMRASCNLEATLAHKFFKCFAPERDGDAGKARHRVLAEKRELLREFRKAYRDKYKELVDAEGERVEQLMGELAHAERERKQAERILSQFERIKSITERKMERYESFARDFFNAVIYHTKEFNRAMLKLKNASAYDSQDINSISEFVDTSMRRILDDDISVEDLNSIENSIERILNSCTARICRERRSAHFVLKARIAASELFSLADEHQELIERLDIDDRLPKIKSRLSETSNKLHLRASGAELAFANKFDVALEMPRICKGLHGLIRAVAIRKEQVRTDKVFSSLHDLQAELVNGANKINADLNSDLGQENFYRYLQQKEAIIIENLVEGRLTAALDHAKRSRLEVGVRIIHLDETGDTESEQYQQLQTAKQRFHSLLHDNLTGGNWTRLVRLRARNLSVKLNDLRTRVDGIEALEVGLSTIISSISDRGVNIGGNQFIEIPEFADSAQIIEFDRSLQIFEDHLTGFENTRLNL